MRSDWVAASARARSMAQRRVGAGAVRDLAAQTTLAAALAMLRVSSYADRLDGLPDLAGAERGIRDTVLWHLRVLAGWLPTSGTSLARAAAGTFEIENITALARQLDGGPPAPDPFELGALATAWPRLHSAGSTVELASILHTSPWGEVDASGPGPLRDTLNVIWLRRLAAIVPATRPWCGAGCVLVAVRGLQVDNLAPGLPLLRILRPVLGRSWEGTDSIPAFAEAIPPSLRPVLRGVSSPQELWRAEASALSRVEKDGFGLLRGALPGPEVVLGALAVLSVDAWRVRAALAAATSGTGSSEVLDAAA